MHKTKNCILQNKLVAVLELFRVLLLIFSKTELKKSKLVKEILKLIYRVTYFSPIINNCISSISILLFSPYKITTLSEC